MICAGNQSDDAGPTAESSANLCDPTVGRFERVYGDQKYFVGLSNPVGHFGKTYV